jgi:aryl-alcohol dehydrogenase
MRVSAAVVEETDAPFTFADLDLDDPRDHEVVVRIVAAGLCHTDLCARGGVTPFPLPAVLGHEGAGVVERIGSKVSTVAVGDHVLISFTSCGHCRSCQDGHPVYCQEWVPLNLLGGSRLDGSATITRNDGPALHGHFFGQSSFATRALVNESAAVKVPHDLDLATLAPLGCSVQTGVGAVLNVACPEPGSTLVVFGVGGVGLAAIMGAVLTPAARIIAVDVKASRLELAAELGATHTIDSSKVDVAEVIRDLTGGVGVNYALETSGRLDVLGTAVSVLSSAGTCVVIGAPALGSTLPVDVTNLLGRGIRLLGSNQGNSNPARFLPQLIALYREGRLPFDRLIRTYPFAEINTAVADAISGKTVKPVLLMPQD